MAGVRAAVASGLERAARRRGKLLLWLVQVAIGIVGVVMFVPATNDDTDTDIANLRFAGALSIWLIAATLRLWRAPEDGIPDVLRLRRRHRRACWRLSVTMLFAATLALLTVAYFEWQADTVSSYVTADVDSARAATAGTTGLWLLCVSPLPGVFEALLWRLWPRSIHRALRTARAVEALSQLPRPDALDGFRPERGAYGRPRAVYELRPVGAPSAQSCTVWLSGGRQTWPDLENLDLSSKSRSWTPPIALRWDGSALALTDSAGHVIPVPVSGRDAPAPGGRIRRPVAEIVWYTEPHPATARGTLNSWTYRTTRLLLLDADGFRVGTIDRVAAEWKEFVPCARAAAVEFNAYDLGSGRSTEGGAARWLFPRRWRQLWSRAA